MAILETNPNESQSKMASPLRIFAIFLIFFALFQLLAGVAMIGYGLFFGMDFQGVQNVLANNAVGANPNFQRGIILINHLFVFICQVCLLHGLSQSVNGLFY